MEKYKNIIPNLVSLDTSFSSLPGFYLSEDFIFYNEITSQNRFHYKIIIDNNIHIPENFDYRNGYYIKYKNYWLYERKINKLVSLKFKYDLENKILYFNDWYRLIPFEIGKIQPMGKHISDLINLDLFLSNIIVINGCSFSYKGKIYCLLAPSFNGKTSFMNWVIDKGGKYISENILVIDYKRNWVFPTSCQTRNFERIHHKLLFHKINNNNKITTKEKYDKLIIYQTSKSKNYQLKEKTLFDYLRLKSLFFFSNNFLLSFLFEENLNYKVFKIIEEIRDTYSKIDNLIIDNYNFQKIIDQ